MCNYNSGPGIWDEIEFTVDLLDVRANTLSGDWGSKVFVTFLIPDGVTVILMSPKANLLSSESGKKIELIALDHRTGHGDQAKTDGFNQPMVGHTYHERRKDKQEQYYFSFVTTEFLDKKFEVQLPDISINGKQVKIPVVRFKRERTLAFASLNC